MDLRLYKPGNGIGTSANRVDPKRCAAEVYITIGRWGKFSQCSRNAKYDAIINGQAVKVCHTHRPDTTAAREAAKEARYAKQDMAWKRATYRPGDYRAALQAIADGHNDPRALAREALQKWNDYTEPTV